MPPVRPSHPPRRVGAGFIIKLAAVRARYSLGSRFAPGNTVAHAARLFCTPFASSRTRARIGSLATTSQRHDIRIGDDDIATYVWGDPGSEPYVLFVHGWSSFGLRVEPWVARLRKAGFAVVSFDQPGHGHSGGKLVTLPEFSRTLLAVGRHYGEAAGVIAHSLGGAATTLALAAGLAAKRIVLIAPSLDPVAAVARFARLVRLSPRLHETLHARLAARTGVSIHDLQAAPLLPALTQPMYVLHDHDDHDVPFAEGQVYAQGWPGARFRATTGLGHHQILVDAGVAEDAIGFIAQAT